MIQSVAKKIACWLQPYAPEKSLAVLTYGLDLAIYTLVSTAGLILEGILFGMPGACLTIIAVYYFNQTIGGGYHAATHFKCFLTMAVGLALGLLLCSLEWNLTLIVAVGALAIAVLLWHPVVLHPNKQYLLNKIQQCAKRSRAFVVLEGAVFCGALIMYRESCVPYAVALLFSALSRMAGKYRNHISSH